MGKTVRVDSEQAIGVPSAALPRHIAIIMDGNGRWAQARGLSRLAGHYAGTESVREVVRTCSKLGIECVTLYSFSIENWKRPAEEVDGLMTLYSTYLAKEREELCANNVRCMHIGRRDGLPASVLCELDKTIEATRGSTGTVMCLALNYGSRVEITDAVRRIAEDVHRGVVSPDEINEDMISATLGTAGLPDPDLLIRTAGEMRLSNFLLWQLSYAELYVTPVFWPEFREADLVQGIRAFAGRERRFGALATARTVENLCDR